MELLNPNPDADLKVYSIWYNMYPGDDRSKWDENLLTDPRVTHFWDEDKIVGRWMVAQDIVDYPREIVWDAYLLFGPDARWKNVPEPLISWGTPVYHRRHKLKSELLPLLEAKQAEPGYPTQIKIASSTTALIIVFIPFRLSLRIRFSGSE